MVRRARMSQSARISWKVLKVKLEYFRLQKRTGRRAGVAVPKEAFRGMRVPLHPGATNT